MATRRHRGRLPRPVFGAGADATARSGGPCRRGGTPGLYFVFVIDYLARLYLADPRGKWFFRHLVDLALVVLPFMRPLRLLSLAVVIDVLQRAVGHTIRGKVIVYTVCGDEGSDRGTPRGDPAALQLAHRRSRARLW
jgi:hypothetical protein